MNWIQSKKEIKQKRFQQEKIKLKLQGNMSMISFSVSYCVFLILDLKKVECSDWMKVNANE